MHVSHLGRTMNRAKAGIAGERVKQHPYSSRLHDGLRG
jgi:hypothetical protein